MWNRKSTRSVSSCIANLRNPYKSFSLDKEAADQQASVLFAGAADVVPVCPEVVLKRIVHTVLLPDPDVVLPRDVVEAADEEDLQVVR